MELGNALDCVWEPGEVHGYALRLERGADFLVGRVGSEAGLGATLLSPAGEALCRWGPEPTRGCQVAAGTYLVRVAEADRRKRAASAGSYRIEVASMLSAACPRLGAEAFSFAGGGLAGQLPADALAGCWLVDQAAGSVVRSAVTSDADVSAEIIDGGGAAVCAAQWGSDCTLAGPGPYRLVAWEVSGRPSEIRLHLPRLTDPTGCQGASVAGFGDPGSAVVKASRNGGEPHCVSVTAAAGSHLVRTLGEGVSWRAYDEQGRHRCAAGSVCLPGAGQRLNVVVEPVEAQQEWSVEVAVVSTAGGGCATGDLSWSAPARAVAVRWPGQVDCTQVSATAGDRLVVADDAGGAVTAQVLDASGGVVCVDTVSACTLPAGGVVRAVSYAQPDAGANGGDYRVEVRRLNSPIGCPVTAPTVFGARPAAAAAVRCRILSGASRARHLVGAVVTDGTGVRQEPVRLFDGAGVQLCDQPVCDLPAGPVTMLVGAVGQVEHRAFETVLIPTAAAGCRDIPDQMLARPAERGRLDSGGQVDCLQLSHPAGAPIRLLQASDAAVTPRTQVLDATGAQVCDDLQVRTRCVLNGAAPFRLAVAAGAGEYAATVFRTDAAAGCPILPVGAFGTDAGATVTFAADRFAGCAVLPAGHADTELFAFERTADGGDATVTIFGPDGEQVCDLEAGAAAWRDCALPDAGLHLAVAAGAAMKGSFRLTRRDPSQAAKGCQALTPTGLGAPAKGEASHVRFLPCYQIRSAAADVIWVDSRDEKDHSRFRVFAADGRLLGDSECHRGAAPCVVTGFTSYQVVPWGVAAAGKPLSFHLDAWRLASSTGPATECGRLPSLAYGFDRQPGELTAKRSGMCLTGTAAAGDRFLVTATAGTAVAAVSGGDLHRCPVGTGGFTCTMDGDGPPAPVVFVAYPTDHLPAARKVTVEGGCQSGLCGGEKFTATAVSPARLTPGGKRSLTIAGSALHTDDQVMLRDAQDNVIAADSDRVSPDRRTATATVDLTDAKPGTWWVDYASVTGAATTVGTVDVGSAPQPHRSHQH
ncbi:hypothetical protein GCM10010124_36810 [Pilimelia terevasa]|uniref:Uncharacterized protein n=1 Tax=Pilimelia terevasa TaxID=53372 RepID=A0A8J3BQB9_9ACTN|nr:hypothetical protein GCM10010124_36810 [Pilimelia terevasa]